MTERGGMGVGGREVQEGGDICMCIADSFCYTAVQSCPTLYGPMDCSTPGFPLLHHLLELAQTHVHRVRDAIQVLREYSANPLQKPTYPVLPKSSKKWYQSDIAA